MGFNIIALLILAVWMLSGLWGLEQLSAAGDKKDGRIRLIMPWINLIALFAGPIVLLLTVLYPFCRSLKNRTVSFAEKDRSGLEIIKNTSSTGMFGGIDLGDNKVSDTAEAAENLLKQHLARAISAKASDLTIEYHSDGSAVLRSRVKGKWSGNTAIAEAERFAAVIKDAAGLAAVPVVRPLNGSFQVRFRRKLYDVDLSALPVMNGEHLTLIFSEALAEPEKASELGIDAAALAQVRDILSAGASLVLIGGTEKSGRSKTLRAILQEAFPAGRNITLLESRTGSPAVKNVTQMQADAAAGVSMGTLLNAVLNQRPDLIAVDELSGKDVMAGIFKAVSYGIPVIAVVEADDLPGTINRLFSLGAAPADLSRSLSLVIYQQLTRRLCRACAAPEQLPEYLKEYFAAMKFSETALRRASGCLVCRNTGYRGYCGVFEFYTPGSAFKNALAAVPVQQTAVRRAVESETEGAFFGAALRLAADGVISLDSAEALSRSDDEGVI